MARGRHAPPRRRRRRGRHRPAAPPVGRLALVALIVLATPVAAATVLGSSPDEPPAGAEPSPVVTVAPREDRPAPRLRPVARYTIAATGDILVHSSVWERAAGYATGSDGFDFRPMLRPLRSVIGAADLAICHLETPLSPDDTDLSSYPTFNAPREVADAIAFAGYDACSTASNHSLDQGTAGVDDTLAVLEDAGLAHAGTARTERESERITMLPLGSLRVAHLSYTYGLNGLVPPPGEAWRAALIHPGRIVADAHAARRDGADLVAVSLHWGTEYVTEPTAFQRSVARTLARSGSIDVILGHHAHVVQPIDRVGKTWVVYGMGNSLSGMSAPETRDGLVVLVQIERRGDRVRIAGVRYVPTWNETGTFRVLPTDAFLGGEPLPPIIRSALIASRDRTQVVLAGSDARVARGEARRR